MMSYIFILVALLVIEDAEVTEDEGLVRVTIRNLGIASFALHFGVAVSTHDISGSKYKALGQLDVDNLITF